MIKGIGTDIVQIPRIESMLGKYGKQFIERILTKSEIEQYNLLTQNKGLTFLAKRFAAKEAIAKAFGTGIGKDIGFQDIIISNDTSGRPLANIISTIGKDKIIHISISDDPPIAIAFAVVSQ